MTDPRTCSVDGCNGVFIARGFCKKHYNLDRYGKTKSTIVIADDSTEDFWLFVKKELNIA